MKAISYKDDLLVELQDPEYASMYLEQTLETGDMQAFLIALRDVVEARGGVAKIARSARMQRQGLYKVLSSRGNPRLATLQGILEPMGLRVAVTHASPVSPRSLRKRIILTMEKSCFKSHVLKAGA